MRIFESDANNKNLGGVPKTYLRLLPIVFEQQPRDIYWNWVLPEEENTPKPRNLLRDDEQPPQDFSLDNISRVLPFVEVLPALNVSPDGHEMREIADKESDAMVVSNGQEDLIHMLRQLD